MLRKFYLPVMLIALLAVVLSGCAPAAPETIEVVVTQEVEVEVEKEVIVEVEKEVIVEVEKEMEVEEAGPVVVFGAYATAIEEPWDGVIHQALNKAQDDGLIEYTYTDDIGYSGDM